MKPGNLLVFFAVAGLAISPAGASAQQAVEKSLETFESAYEQYASAATALRAGVEKNAATLQEQKRYFDAIVHVFTVQNNLIMRDLSKKQAEPLSSMTSVLEKDQKTLQNISDAIGSATSTEGMKAVAIQVQAYADAYVSQVRQPILSAYVDSFMNDILQPAQNRYDGTKAKIDDAKRKGMKVGEYEKTLQEIRLKLFEVKGFMDDIRKALGEKVIALDQVEDDMSKAQDIMKEIYGLYKDLSLKTGILN